MADSGAHGTHSGLETSDAGTLLQTVESLLAAGDKDHAIALYQRWIEANPKHPLLHAICFNLGATLSTFGDVRGAGRAFMKAIEVAPDFAPPYINLGIVFDQLGDADAALKTWQTLVQRLAHANAEMVGYRTMALRHIILAHERVGHGRAAEEALALSLAVDPSQREVLQTWLAARFRLCRWPIAEPVGGLSRGRIVRSMAPLTAAVFTDDPLLHLASGHAYSREQVGEPETGTAGAWLPPAEPLQRRLRIGYLSSDLRSHAVGYLMTDLFEQHDPAAVEVFAYYCGQPGPDPISDRIRAAVAHWCDIATISDRAAATRIVADGIDILVDLNGHTKGARTKVFAYRPAPIQVNWLGFPGTMGTTYHHYLIADPFIVPPENEIYYSEKVVRLPCYQPNDSKRRISEMRPTRADVGLPETAMVYCCFSSPHKLTRFTLERWLTILRQVPESVLWLLDGGAETNARLKQMMAAAGIDPARLVIAPSVSNPDHLARYPLADLFLDTSPYGAHTTASDSLWMSVPILTLPGRSFASRVCASLSRAAGLEDLICDSSEAYVARAVELGRDRALLQRYKDRLAAEHDRCVMFDTPLLARSLEQLYRDMWEEFRSGLLPRPKLHNMEAFAEIGASLDHEAAELQCHPDYRGLYARLLGYRDTYRPLVRDERLAALNGEANC